MNFGINGKIALVTAATRGLGRGCAEQLAAEGCRVAICSRDSAAAKQAAEAISTQTGAQVSGFGADVGKTEDIGRLLEEVSTSMGAPEILVTNAGGPPPGTYASTVIEEYEKALNLTLMSAVHLIRWRHTGHEDQRLGPDHCHYFYFGQTTNRHAVVIQYGTGRADWILEDHFNGAGTRWHHRERIASRHP
jgi:short-subunit dehydrogenase